MKTGQYAGHEFNAVPVVSGIYITELGLRVPHEHLPYVQTGTGTIPSAKHCGDTVHYEDLVIAFDKYDHEIFVGHHLWRALCLS
jgi:hypothetical protein